MKSKSGILEKRILSESRLTLDRMKSFFAKVDTDECMQGDTYILIHAIRYDLGLTVYSPRR